MLGAPAQLQGRAARPAAVLAASGARKFVNGPASAARRSASAVAFQRPSFRNTRPLTNTERLVIRPEAARGLASRPTAPAGFPRVLTASLERNPEVWQDA